MRISDHPLTTEGLCKKRANTEIKKRPASYKFCQTHPVAGEPRAEMKPTRVQEDGAPGHG